MDKLKELLIGMNGPRLGSFGEYLFVEIMNKKKAYIISHHKDQVDFYINDRPVDVKTSRQRINSTIKRLARYSGQRRNHETN